MTDFEPEIQLGSTGLRRAQGRITEERNRKLKGDRAIKLYREMRDSSPEVAVSLLLTEHMIRNVEWRVQAADETPEAGEQAADTELAFKDMSHSFNDFISEVLSMLWAGYSYFEIVYKIRRGPTHEDPKFRSRLDDGKYGWRKIEIRSQETIEKWEFDDDGGIRGAYQQEATSSYGGGGGDGGIFLPIEKCLLFRTDISKGNPEGRSLLRSAILPYEFSKRLKEFEAIGIERNLAGMPVMQVPPELLSPSATSQARASRQALEKWITQVRMDEYWGGLLPAEVDKEGNPTGYKFELVSASGRPMDTDPIIRRYQAEILMLFRTQFLALGTGATGSFALADSQTNLFSVALGAIMQSIQQVINTFLIPRRQRMNGIDPSLDPKIVHGDLESRDLADLASYMQSLTTTGHITPNNKLENRLLEMADLPVPEHCEDELEDDGTQIAAPEETDSAQSKEFLDAVLRLNASVAAEEITPDRARTLLVTSFGVSEDLARDLV